MYLRQTHTLISQDKKAYLSIFLHLFTNRKKLFLIANFRIVVNIAFFLFADSPAPVFYVPTFRNTPSHLHRPCEQEQNQFLPP